MTEATATSFEDVLIADMRAHGGTVTAGPLEGHPLLVMTSTGAKSRRARRAILTWSRDGDDYIVAGTAGGSHKDPSWIRNIELDPDVTIEVGNRTVAATATVVADAAERARLWDRHVAVLPWFAAYPEQTGRTIPLVRLTPAGQ